MERRVGQKSHPENSNGICDVQPKNKKPKTKPEPTLTQALPSDLIAHIFSHNLNQQDRANFSATSRYLRQIGHSRSLWQWLDLRFYNFNKEAAFALSQRCTHLRGLRFNYGVDSETAYTLCELQAFELLQIIAESCNRLSDSALWSIAFQHRMLESVYLGPQKCESLTSDGLYSLAYCCPNLKKVWIAGVENVNKKAINAFAKKCPRLADVGFIQSRNIDEAALGKLKSVQFLSLEGSVNIKWDDTAKALATLPNLLGLDVSRTNVSKLDVRMFLSTLVRLKALVGLFCPVFEALIKENMIQNKMGKTLITVFSDNFRELDCLVPVGINTHGDDVFTYWRKNQMKDERFNKMMTWLESVLSNVLFNQSTYTSLVYDDFWNGDGANFLLSLVQSTREEVSEWALQSISRLVQVDAVEPTIFQTKKVEAILQANCISLLLKFSTSNKEGIQHAAISAVTKMCMSTITAEEVCEKGGIKLLVNILKISQNRLIIEAALEALSILSAGLDQKDAIVEVGGTEFLLDLAWKYPHYTGSRFFEFLVGIMINLVIQYKHTITFAQAGGAATLVRIAVSSQHEGVQNQAVQALITMATQEGDDEDALIQVRELVAEAVIVLTYCTDEGARKQAAGAMYRLAHEEKTRAIFVEAGGVQAMIDLVHISEVVPTRTIIEYRVTGAFWGLAKSEPTSSAIVEGGGFEFLFHLLRHTPHALIHENACRAIWKLAFNPEYAFEILVQEGVDRLLSHRCRATKLAEFFTMVTLSLIKWRVDEIFGRNKPAEFRILISQANVCFRQVRAYLKQKKNEPSIIPDIRSLQCSSIEIERLAELLASSNKDYQSFAAFVFWQLTAPGGRHSIHNSTIIGESGARYKLATMAAGEGSPQATHFANLAMQNFAQNDLRNMTEQ